MEEAGRDQGMIAVGQIAQHQSKAEGIAALQQIEGNLIYPHVVGGTVGLPSVWVLAAVSIGGSLMGIVGMLLFIPGCSVCYALLREQVGKRLEKRQIPSEKWTGETAASQRSKSPQHSDTDRK